MYTRCPCRDDIVIPPFNPFTTEARFYDLNAMAFSTEKRASVVKGLINGGLRSARVDDVIGTVCFYADILRPTHCVKLEVNSIS